MPPVWGSSFQLRVDLDPYQCHMTLVLFVTCVGPYYVLDNATFVVDMSCLLLIVVSQLTPAICTPDSYNESIGYSIA